MALRGGGLWLQQGCAGKIKGHRIIESWNSLGWKGTLKVSYSSPPSSLCAGIWDGSVELGAHYLAAEGLVPDFFRKINVFHSPEVSSTEIWAVPLHAPPDLPPQCNTAPTIPAFPLGIPILPSKAASGAPLCTPPSSGAQLGGDFHSELSLLHP